MRITHQRHSQRRSVTRLVLVAGVVAVTISAGTAWGAVPNLELHRSTSANNSLTKSTNAACPSGRTMTGVGGDVTNAGGAVVIDDLSANSSRTQNLTTGYEVEPLAANWYLHSYAICASSLAGATRITAATATDGNDAKAVTATCPAGTLLTGASGLITGGVGNVVMDDLRPNGNPASSVTVTGYEIDPDTSWSATAIALCAAPLPGLERVVSTSVNNSSNKSATATCPAGKKVIGLGGEIGGATGEVVIDDYTPNDILTSVTVTGNEAVDIDGPYAGNWTVTAYAICATE
jgi:hypothetical protein